MVKKNGNGCEITGIVYGYGRVSHDPKGDKPSKEVQAERMEAWADLKGLTYGGSFVDDDRRWSDWNRREEWQMLMKILKPGDAIVTPESSRIARGVKEMLTIGEDMQEHGISIVCLNADFDTSSAIGRMAFRTMLNLYQFETEQLAERVAFSKERSRGLGHWQGGKISLGYRHNGEQGKLELDPDTAPIVIEAFTMRADGKSYPKIEAELERRGVRGVRGGKLNASTLWRMFRNRMYIGEGKWADERFEYDPEYVPPLIDPPLWDSVQAVEQTNAIRGGTVITRGKYLPSGLCKCGKCGVTMTRRVRHGKETAKNKPGKVEWVCMQAHGQGTCSGVMVKASILEGFLTTSLLDHIDDFRLKAEVEAKSPTDNGNGRGEITGKKVANLKKKLAQARGRQGKLLDLYTDGRIDQPVLRQRSTYVTAEIGELEREIAELESGQALKDAKVLELAEFTTLADEWDKLAFEEQRGILVAFCEKVTVQPGRGTDRINIKWVE